MDNGTLPEVDLSACIASLISYEEIRTMFGIQKATAWRWRSTGVLPEPAGEIGGRAVWSREVIIEWANSTGRTIIC